MEQLRQQNAPEKKLKQKFRAREHILLDSEKRKEQEMVNSLELQKDKKIEK